MTVWDMTPYVDDLITQLEELDRDQVMGTDRPTSLQFEKAPFQLQQVITEIRALLAARSGPLAPNDAGWVIDDLTQIHTIVSAMRGFDPEQDQAQDKAAYLSARLDGLADQFRRDQSQW